MALGVEPSNPTAASSCRCCAAGYSPTPWSTTPPPSGDKYLLPSSQQVPWTTAVVGYKWIFYFTQGSSTLAKFTFKRKKQRLLAAVKSCSQEHFCWSAAQEDFQYTQRCNPVFDTRFQLINLISATARP